MELNTASGGTLRVEREDGEPQVGDVAEPDGEWLMPDGVTIVVENGFIVEIRPKEEDAPEGEVNPDEEKKGDDDATEELDERDEEEQRLCDRIAELEKENEELRQQLEEASKNAKTTDDLRILNAVKMAGGEKALSIIKSAYVPKQRQPDGEQAKKRADDAITSDAILEKFNKVNRK